MIFMTLGLYMFLMAWGAEVEKGVIILCNVHCPHPMKYDYCPIWSWLFMCCRYCNTESTLGTRVIKALAHLLVQVKPNTFTGNQLCGLVVRLSARQARLKNSLTVIQTQAWKDKKCWIHRGLLHSIMSDVSMRCIKI